MPSFTEGIKNLSILLFIVKFLLGGCHRKFFRGLSIVTGHLPEGRRNKLFYAVNNYIWAFFNGLPIAKGNLPEDCKITMVYLPNSSAYNHGTFARKVPVVDCH